MIKFIEYTKRIHTCDKCDTSEFVNTLPYTTIRINNGHDMSDEFLYIDICDKCLLSFFHLNSDITDKFIKFIKGENND